jgi:hypothetical protein
MGRMCQHSPQNAALDSEMHKTGLLIATQKMAAAIHPTF